MKKPWNDQAFSKIDNIHWNEERKKNNHEKLMQEISKLENQKQSEVFVFKYAASLILFLAVIFVGYNLLTQEQQTPAVTENEDTEWVEETKAVKEPEVVINDKEKLRYYGTVDSNDNYVTIAMTDLNVNYFLPVTARGTIDTIKEINQSSFGDQFRNNFGLSSASYTPIKSYEIKNNHLHLYFDKDILLNKRGSTGTSMAAFSISTFASNFSNQVTHYTGYGDGEPFSHYGEDIELINVSLDIQHMFYPISTEKGIFLQQQYNYKKLPIEEVLSKFFSDHLNTITKQGLDLSMISFEEIKNIEGKTVVRLFGDINDAYEKNLIEIDSLKRLIVHGVGANLREHIEDSQVQIFLNEELLFDNLLRYIRINNLEDMGVQLEEASNEAKLISAAESALTHMENEAWELLMRLVHPEKGLLFSPYAYVEKDQNVTFSKEEVANFATNEEGYIFGINYASDEVIYEFTPKDFIRSMLIHYEYRRLANVKVPYGEISFNKPYQPSGGIINNLEEAYPEGKYVEFYAPPPSLVDSHLWQALRFVFEEHEGNWYLVAIVRDVHSP